MSNQNAKPILIAVAWPYVNGDLHVGHLAGYLLPADITARFHRLIGNDVLMVSGSDCHGTPITVEADKQGKTAQEIVDKYHPQDVALFKQYHLSYNLYTTTTSQIHKQVTQQLFLDLLNNGYIFKKSEPQYYSPEDNKFLPDRYVEGGCPLCGAQEQRSDQCEACGRMLEQGTLINPYSKLTKKTVTLKETEHYYIDLAKLQDQLEEFVDSRQDIWRKWVYQEAKGWIKEGLQPRAITRDLDWGIEIPVKQIPDELKLDTFASKRLYVWFEAIIGYLSAPQEWQQRLEGKYTDDQPVIFYHQEGQNTDWTNWWKNKKTYQYNFLGQDNVVFHTILWPGELIGADRGYNLPNDVPANKFMNFAGKKFSKSRDWSIDSKAIGEKYGVDLVRFALASNLPEYKTANFTWEGFVEAINNELVANLGNFIHRTLVFLQNKFNGEIQGEANWLDSAVEAKIAETFTQTARLLPQVELSKSLKVIMQLAAFGNKYFDDSKIWEKVKDDSESAQLEAKKSIYNLLQIVNALPILIEPYLPESAQRLRQYLNQPEIKPQIGVNQWQANFPTEFQTEGEIKPLFAKLDKESVLKEPL